MGEAIPAANLPTGLAKAETLSVLLAACLPPLRALAPSAFLSQALTPKSILYPNLHLRVRFWKAPPATLSADKRVCSISPQDVSREEERVAANATFFFF